MNDRQLMKILGLTFDIAYATGMMKAAYESLEIGAKTDLIIDVLKEADKEIVDANHGIQKIIAEEMEAKDDA